MLSRDLGTHEAKNAPSGLMSASGRMSKSRLQTAAVTETGAELRSRAPTSDAASPWQNAHDGLFDHVAVTTAVHLDVQSPKDAGCNACRNKSLHVEILATPKMDEERPAN